MIGFLTLGMREIPCGAIAPVLRGKKFQSTEAELAALGTTRQGPPVPECRNKKARLSVIAPLQFVHPLAAVLGSVPNPPLLFCISCALTVENFASATPNATRLPRLILQPKQSCVLRRTPHLLRHHHLSVQIFCPTSITAPTMWN